MLHTKPEGHWPFGSGEEIFEGFYHIWVWWPSWSCDPDPANKHLFPYPTGAPYEIWLWLAQWFSRRSLRMVDGQMDGQSMTISSPMSLKVLLNSYASFDKGLLEWWVDQILKPIFSNWINGLQYSPISTCNCTCTNFSSSLYYRFQQQPSSPFYEGHPISNANSSIFSTQIGLSQFYLYI